MREDNELFLVIRALDPQGEADVHTFAWAPLPFRVKYLFAFDIYLPQPDGWSTTFVHVRAHVDESRTTIQISPEYINGMSFSRFGVMKYHWSTRSQCAGNPHLPNPSHTENPRT